MTERGGNSRGGRGLDPVAEWGPSVSELVEAVAQRTAELVLERLGERSAAPEHVDAAELARVLGVARSWVYAHSAELGAVRLGDGPRSRLRFDVETARAAVACLTSKQSDAPVSPVAAGDRARSAPARLPESVAPLPAEGPSAASAAVAVLTPRPDARRGGRRRDAA